MAITSIYIYKSSPYLWPESVPTHVAGVGETPDMLPVGMTWDRGTS